MPTDPPKNKFDPVTTRLTVKLGSPKETRMLAMASSMGMSLVVATFMGLGLGYWLDKKLGTAPWLLLVGLLIGIAAGFKNIFVIADRLDKKNKATNEKSTQQQGQ